MKPPAADQPDDIDRLRRLCEERGLLPAFEAFPADIEAAHANAEFLRAALARPADPPERT